MKRAEHTISISSNYERTWSFKFVEWMLATESWSLKSLRSPLVSALSKSSHKSFKNFLRLSTQTHLHDTNKRWLRNQENQIWTLDVLSVSKKGSYCFADDNVNKIILSSIQVNIVNLNAFSVRVAHEERQLVECRQGEDGTNDYPVVIDTSEELVSTASIAQVSNWVRFATQLCGSDTCKNETSSPKVGRHVTFSKNISGNTAANFEIWKLDAVRAVTQKELRQFKIKPSFCPFSQQRRCLDTRVFTSS